MSLWVGIREAGGAHDEVSDDEPVLTLNQQMTA
jgi:hypothetical protein